MATAEGAEGVETEKTPAERLYEAVRDGDVAALDALLPVFKEEWARALSSRPLALSSASTASRHLAALPRT